MNRNKSMVIVCLIGVLVIVACKITPTTIGSMAPAPLPEAPSWAYHDVFGLVNNPRFDGHLATDTQSVTLKGWTKVDFDIYNIGQIQLNNAKLIQSAGVVFYDNSGKVVTDYKTMDRKAFYDFVVNGPGSYFVLVEREKADPFEGQTHLRLAKRP